MIKGEHISLRPIREDDLDEVHRNILDLQARGPWYPLPLMSLTKFRAAFDENGLWSRDEGLFVIVDDHDKIIGNVDWERLNGSVQDVEAAYRVYRRDDWGKGIATEALQLLTGWLFDIMPINRIRLVMHVDNLGSHRVAEKCGYTKESTSPASWQHKGEWQDVDVYVLARHEHAARQPRGEAKGGA